MCHNWENGFQNVPVLAQNHTSYQECNADTYLEVCPDKAVSSEVVKITPHDQVQKKCGLWGGGGGGGGGAVRERGII